MDDRFSIEELMREIARYLMVVDAVRTAGCKPVWLPESAPSARRDRP
jgi:hypothetical protein